MTSKINAAYKSDFKFFKHFLWAPYDLPVIEQHGVQVIVFYLAFHYRSIPRLKSDLLQAYDFLRNFSLLPGHVAIYKEPTASHFNTSGGDFRPKTGCAPKPRAELWEGQKWRIDEAVSASLLVNVTDPSRGVQGQVGGGTVCTLPVFNLSSTRVMSHVERNDCLHHCYIPSFYWPMYAMLNLILYHSRMAT